MSTLLDNELDALDGQLNTLATKTQSQFILLSISAENGSRCLSSEGLDKLSSRLLMDALNHTDTIQARVACAQRAAKSGVPIPPFNWNSKGYQMINLKDDLQVDKHVKKVLGSLNQQNCKVLAKAWVRAIEPKKQTRYPYKYGDARKPPWWPEDVRHKEPDHLMRFERIQLMYAILRLCACNLEILADGVQTSWGLLNKTKKYSIDEIFYIISVLVDIENGSIEVKDPAFVPLLVNATNAQFPYMGLAQAKHLATSGIFASGDEAVETLILNALPREELLQKGQEQDDHINGATNDEKNNHDEASVRVESGTSAHQSVSSLVVSAAPVSPSCPSSATPRPVNHKEITSCTPTDSEEQTPTTDGGFTSYQSNDEEVWQSPPSSLSLSPASDIFFSDFSIESTNNDFTASQETIDGAVGSGYGHNSSFLFDSEEKTIKNEPTGNDSEQEEYDYHALTFIGSTMPETSLIRRSAIGYTNHSMTSILNDHHSNIPYWNCYSNNDGNEVKLESSGKRDIIEDDGEECSFETRDKRIKYD